MDITEALAPKSDQLDAIELVHPRTFTIDAGSRLGRRDDDGQAVVEVRLVDFPRVWRPSKGMLDVIVAVWGTNAKEWAGHQVTLYNDTEVTFGKDKVGGIRISHMSGIDKTTTVQIRGRGRGARKLPWRIEPIAAPKAQVDLRALAAAFKAAGVTDKAGMLAFAVEVAGRDLASAGDLTADEVDRVVEALRHKALDGEVLDAEALDVPTEEPPAGEA